MFVQGNGGNPFEAMVPPLWDLAENLCQIEGRDHVATETDCSISKAFESDPLPFFLLGASATPQSEKFFKPAESPTETLATQAR